jgi:hypothetical protein
MTSQNLSRTQALDAKEGAMEFRDAIGVLVSASKKRLTELDDLAVMAGDEGNAEALAQYTAEQKDIEQAIAAGNRYLEKTPT